MPGPRGLAATRQGSARAGLRFASRLTGRPIHAAQQVAHLQRVGHQAGAFLRRQPDSPVGEHLSVHDFDEPAAVLGEMLHQLGTERLAQGGLVGAGQFAAAREFASVLKFDAVMAEKAGDLVKEGFGGELKVGGAGSPVEQDHGGQQRGVLAFVAAGRVRVFKQHQVAVADAALHGVVGLLRVAQLEQPERGDGAHGRRREVGHEGEAHGVGYFSHLFSALPSGPEADEGERNDAGDDEKHDGAGQRRGDDQQRQAGDEAPDGQDDENAPRCLRHVSRAERGLAADRAGAAEVGRPLVRGKDRLPAMPF